MPQDKQSHVLIVEDDVFLSEIYQKKFEMEGFKVSMANNGEKGLADIKKKKPDIVLLEILLPKLDGFAVLEAAKADVSIKNIPIILLTNLGQKDDVRRGIEEGAAGYLIKTHFKPSEVVDKVREVLHKK
ncbi:MAG: Phosphate regulon transcriptional regulatory protein PhoB (SphR) [Candidatus Magasanikbacteria bacterium GW2011_GWA2_40_10]|uniref:Phosphate regulon transcriptional regulatory protein PhoB (SphR) n=1 Tax=Candidatus Magasanikbacteria bacterium GW2011_GWA2_40_10 TaxID=1619037 RepID=A0A0G0T962_9BACT|nr:MAG: Phosphate regulon transcriptional regulatory protein PhoB (SphR) [Candidatus Magasanikbacteria bacterium GW2011_GWA2_40_10]